MSTDVSLDVIRSTQESLGKIVKKPPLSEKLLKKPPFRFLHDIVTAVNKSTGFFDGLFTEEELVSDNVKDRESKIAFLQKVIEVVNLVTESTLSVRPSKVIAGLEPEKTNELLQKIGLAIQQNLNSKEAIEAVASKHLKDTSITTKDERVNNNTLKKGGDKHHTNSKVDVDYSNKNMKSKQLKSNQLTVEKKVSKDQNKLESNKASRNISKNSKKDISKKPTAESKNKGKNNQKQTPAKEQNISNYNQPSVEVEDEPSITSKSNGTTKVVELKDIIDDFDDINSTSEVIISNGLTASVLNTNTVISPMASPKEETKAVKVSSARPQSRLSRQRSSLSHNLDVTNNENSDLSHEIPKQIEVETPPSGQFQHGDTDDKTFTEPVHFIENVNKNNEIKSGDTKPRNLRSTSSRKSTKIKTEPLKASHSLSIESKSDGDILDQRSISSESENKEVLVTKTTLRPPSVRPSSARPGAPRLRERNTDVIVIPSEPAVVGKVHVIVENYDQNHEDDEGSVEIMQVAIDDNVSNIDNSNANNEHVSSAHGHLVQQILETQKELANEESSKIEIEWEYGVRREREASHKEIESIRSGLQSLSRAANPLAKLMDYIQEDVEVMRQELLQWRNARQSAAVDLRHQYSLTEQQIQPLQTKLKQLEERIAEQTEQIFTVKSNIHRNSQKIIKFVDGDD